MPAATRGPTTTRCDEPRAMSRVMTTTIMMMMSRDLRSSHSRNSASRVASPGTSFLTTATIARSHGGGGAAGRSSGVPHATVALRQLAGGRARATRDRRCAGAAGPSPPKKAATSSGAHRARPSTRMTVSYDMRQQYTGRRLGGPLITDHKRQRQPRESDVSSVTKLPVKTPWQVDWLSGFDRDLRERAPAARCSSARVQLSEVVWRRAR